MSLKASEIVGAVTALIPFISTVTSSIKAYEYYKIYSKIENEVTNKTDKLGQDKFTLHFETQHREIAKELFIASILEAIPLVNIVAAIFSASVLSDLSKLREIEKNSTQVLCERYDISYKKLTNEQKNNLGVSLKLINNLPIKDKTLTHGNGRTEVSGAMLCKRQIAEEVLNVKYELNSENLETEIKKIINTLIRKKELNSIEYESILKTHEDEYKQLMNKTNRRPSEEQKYNDLIFQILLYKITIQQQNQLIKQLNEGLENQLNFVY